MEPAARPSSIFRRSEDASGLDAKRAADLDKAIVINENETYSESSSSSGGSHEQSFGASGGSKKNAPSEADMRRRRKCIVLLSVIPLVATLAALAALLIGRSSGDGGVVASQVDSLSTEDTGPSPSPNASSTPANPNDNDWDPLVLPVEERDDNTPTEATVSSLTHGTLRAKTTAATSAPLSSAQETTTESTALSLAHVANDGSPPNHFPLKECQGDCNRDEDCEGALLCFEGNGLESVPGCSGDRLDGAGYCFHRPTANYLFASKERPLGNCMGYCEDDGDCGPGLICEHRSGTETIPGCNGLGVQGKGYCRYQDS
ncbi:hypothetical protein ACHAXT_002106 [Thalassiosira profunda]